MRRLSWIGLTCCVGVGVLWTGPELRAWTVRLVNLQQAKVDYAQHLDRAARTHAKAMAVAQQRLAKAYDDAIADANKLQDVNAAARLMAEKATHVADAAGIPRLAANQQPVVARQLFTVADDFIIDVFHNGTKVPDAKRTLLDEIFGATVERIDVEVRAGDWLVFNVVNNRLRWGGAYYFAAAGLVADRELTFATEFDSGRWSCCDDPMLVDRFVGEPLFLAENRVRKIATPWHEGDARMNSLTGNWSGQPVWGKSRNTWIKVRVGPAGKAAARP